jgi:hypothetical protein
MYSLVLVLLLQTQPTAPKPQHQLQCEDAERLVEALTAAGLGPDGGNTLTLPKLECDLAGGPPGTERVGCSGGVHGTRAMRIWRALSAAKLESSGAMMKASFAFSMVRCAPGPLGMECSLTNEAMSGTGDLRTDGIAKRRASCGGAASRNADGGTMPR